MGDVIQLPRPEPPVVEQLRTFAAELERLGFDKLPGSGHVLLHVTFDAPTDDYGAPLLDLIEAAKKVKAEGSVEDLLDHLIHQVGIHAGIEDDDEDDE